MSYKKFYISYRTYNWSKNLDAGIFVDQKKYNKFLSSTEIIDAHSSLEDLNLKLHDLEFLIQSAEKIILVDLNIDFVEKITSDSLYLYLHFFKILKKYSNKVENFEWYKNIDKSLFTDNLIKRDTTTPAVWVTGCSVTYGLGVNEAERYSTLLKSRFNCPVITLAKPGSSIAWQTDQILRADIKAGDVVIWGLTSFSRVDYTNGYQWKTASIRHYLKIPIDKQHWKIDFFNSFCQTMPSIRQILQVTEFCKKIGATLFLINLLESTWLDFVFGQDDNYLDLTKGFDDRGKMLFLDVGDDGDHPGPQQHREYADAIYNFIKEKKCQQNLLM